MLEKLFLIILVVHFLADFVLQTNWQAQNKAINIQALAYHVLTYSLVWFAMSYAILGDLGKALFFFVVTYFAHLITDYFTSKLAKKFFDKQDYHNGFKVVGFDQILHYIQLYITFMILI